MRKTTPLTRIQYAFNKWGKIYWKNIPLDAIFKLLKYNGVKVLDEDGTPWEGFLCGESSYADFKIVGMKNRKQLRLAWYKMQSERYEITAYLY